MRPDYKLSTRTHGKRRKARYRILLAVGVLAATLGSVKFLDLNSVAVPEMTAHAAEPDTISIPLRLPNQGDKPIAAETLETQPSVTAGATEPKSATKKPEIDDIALLEVAPKPPVQAVASIDAAPSILDKAISIPPPDIDTPLREPVARDEAVEEILAEPEITSTEYRWTEHQIASGESLSKIFAKQGLEPGLLHRIVNSGKDAKSLAKIRPGQTLRFQFDNNGELTRLELHRNRVESLRIAITDDAIDVEQVSKALNTQIATASGLIESSLFLDGQKAGLSDAKIMELATIFGWDIDFALEIRAGDQFRVLFEEQYLDGEKLRDGPILAAEFTNRGKTFRAIRYEDSKGEVGYFDGEGNSKRRAFIRTPIKFARVSSRFNPKRWHPVLKRWRPHKGVDYAAPTGTPIKASGDGKVIFRGTKGGYGRTVILQHAGKYTTLYAHMSKYSSRAKVGKRVKQGQVIGYVGSSGVSTGPHLHYEFRVNGVHKDPLKVKLPKALALPKSELAAFSKISTPLVAKLETIAVGTMVASNNTNP